MVAANLFSKRNFDSVMVSGTKSIRRKKMKKRLFTCLCALMLVMMPVLSISVYAVPEPYNPFEAKYKYSCTWFVWQEAYDRLRVALPYYPYYWGNAGKWLDYAREDGYNTGSVAKPNSIAVYSDSSIGHVAYVVSVNGNTMIVDEGGRTDHSKYPNGINRGASVSSVVGGQGTYNGSRLIGFIYLVDSATTPPENLPAAPSNFKASWAESGWKAVLSWNVSENATSYEVQYTTPKTGGWRNDADYKGGTTYTTSGLKDYESYSFRVRAANASGYSTWTELAFYKTVNIALNANGGSVSPSSISKTYDSNTGVPSTYSGLPTPIRDGYSFDGWYTAASGGSRVTDSTKVIETQSQTIYAHWTKSDIAVTGVGLTQNTLALEIGDDATLTATINPSNATDKSITWSSSNPSVATVNNGKVTAVGTGNATITATAGGKSASCTVTVSEANVAVTGVTLSQTTLTLNPNGSATLTATVNPANATEQAVTWSSSNPSVAAVNNGKVTAVGAGSATVTATAGSKSASCAVTVSRAKCVITYGANGGSGIMQETKVDSGTTIKLPNNGFTAPPGKQFKCWRIGVNNFPAGTEYTVNSDLLILAIWEDVYVAPSVSARLSIEGKSVSPGGDVTVPVKLEENPGLIGFNLHIDYDRNKLELVDIKPVAAFSDLMSNSNDPIRVLWVSGAGEAVKGNIAVFEMAFRAKSGATGQAQIRITAIEAESDVGSVTLGDAVGTISIVEPTRVNRGDVNGDGKISLSDAVMLKRYLVGVDVKIDTTNSDVNGDGKVSLADIVMLQKHLIGIISIGN